MSEKKELKTAEKQREKFDKLKQTRKGPPDPKAKSGIQAEQGEQTRSSVDSLIDDDTPPAPHKTEQTVKKTTDSFGLDDLIETVDESNKKKQKTRKEETKQETLPVSEEIESKIETEIKDKEKKS